MTPYKKENPEMNHDLQLLLRLLRAAGFLLLCLAPVTIARLLFGSTGVIMVGLLLAAIAGGISIYRNSRFGIKLDP